MPKYFIECHSNHNYPSLNGIGKDMGIYFCNSNNVHVPLMTALENLSEHMPHKRALYRFHNGSWERICYIPDLLYHFVKRYSKFVANSHYNQGETKRLVICIPVSFNDDKSLKTAKFEYEINSDSWTWCKYKNKEE